MRAATWFALFVAVIAFIAQCHAGRTTPLPWLGDPIRRTSGSLKNVQEHLGRGRFGAEEDSKYLDIPAYSSIRYFVLPSKHQSFIDAWKKMQGSIQDREGLKVFDLHKTMSDNMLFFEYQEWETVRHSMDHCQSKEFQEFAQFVDNEGIEWEARFLKKQCEEGVCDQETQQKEQTGKKTHALSFYDVPPGEADEFVRQWTQTAKQTQQEKGNYIYSLHKFALDNTRFYSYGMWESWQDLVDHMKSDHFRQLREHITKTDIEWVSAITDRILEQEEAN